MPESGGVVDRLVIATEFDESGLDSGVQTALNRIERFTKGVEQAKPTLTLNTDLSEQSLLELGAAFDRFIGEARDLEAFPNFTTDQAQRELEELIAAFPGLQQAIKGIDPSGVLGVMAQQSRAAATALQQTVTAQQQAAQETARAAAALQAEADAARQAGNTVGALAAALARAGDATRALAAEQARFGPAQAQPFAPAIDAAGTLTRALGVTAREAQRVHQILNQPIVIPPVPPDPNLILLARGYEGFRARADEARASAERLRATMLQQGQAARLASGDNAAAAASIGRLGASAATIGPAFLASGAGASRLRAGLSGLAVAASGASPAVGQLVSGLLLLGGGSIAVLGAAAGIALVAGAINLLEAPIRKAREETEQLLKTLTQARIGRLSAFDQVGLQVEEVRQKMEDATGRIQRLQNIVAQNQAMAGGAFRQGQLDQELATLGKLTDEMVDLVRLRAQLQSAAGEELIKGLETQIATFGKTGAEAQRLAIALNTTLLPAQRRDALARVDSLIGLERQAKAFEEATKRAKELAKFQERFAADLKAVMGGLGDLGAPVMMLKPHLDLSEIRAAVAASQAAFAKGLGDDELERARLAGLRLADALAEVDLSLKDIGDASKGLTGLADSTLDVIQGLDGIAGAAGNIGLIGQEASRVIGDVLALGDALNAVLTSASSGNVLGLVGAGVNLLGGLLGGGPSEHERIVEDNLRRIAENTAQRNEQFSGLGGATDLARIIGQLIGDSQFRGAAVQATLPGGVGLRGQEEVERQLTALGLTLADLDRMAQVHNLDLLDDKGRLVVGALDQLEQAILADIQASLRFRDTLDDLTLAGDLRARITGEGLDPTSAFQRQLDAAFDLEGFAVTDFFKGIDLGDPDALRRASLGLLDAFENGQLDASKLGKLSREDILRILGDAAGLIEGLGDSALDAANELSIIPKGFRQAALAFEAQIPGLTAPLPPPPPPLPPPPPPAPTVDEVIPPGEAITADAALERLIPEPILISGAELLDRMVAFGAIPATTGLPTGLPSDGAALPQIAASMASATSALAQIAAGLNTGQAQLAGGDVVTTQQELGVAVGRLMELLAKAKIGQTVEHVSIEIDSDGKDPRDVALEIRRALENISMADYGRTDRWGQT